MAITAVKATKATASSGTSVTMTSLTATAGNALLVGSGGYEDNVTSGSTTVTRTGDTFTTDIQGNTSGSSDLQHIAISSAPNVGAGGTNLVTSVSSASGVVSFALEVSGLPSSSMLDSSSPAIKTATTVNATSNSETNNSADAIFVTYCGNESGGTVTLTVGGGWTETVGGTTMKETNGNSFPAGGFSYQIVSTAAARNGAYTVTLADWGMIIACYKMDSTPAGLPPGLGPNVGMEAGMMATLSATMR